MRAIRSDFEQPLAVDPLMAIAGDRERVRQRQRPMLHDPASRCQVPEKVVVANRTERRQREGDEQRDRNEPPHRARV
jgi:hypothetical protein